MKQFDELTDKEKFEIVCGIEKLRESLDNYMYESEIEDYALDKLRILKNTVDWSVGIYSSCYLEIKDDSKCSEFLYLLEDVISCYGCAESVSRKIKQCNKLRGTNLFNYECENLCSLYFDTEIQPSIKYVEDMQYKTYLGEYCTEIADIFSCWLENQDLNIIYDKDSEEWCLEETKRYYAKRV